MITQRFAQVVQTKILSTNWSRNCPSEVPRRNADLLRANLPSKPSVTIPMTCMTTRNRKSPRPSCVVILVCAHTSTAAVAQVQIAFQSGLYQFQTSSINQIDKTPTERSHGSSLAARPWVEIPQSAQLTQKSMGKRLKVMRFAPLFSQRSASRRSQGATDMRYPSRHKPAEIMDKPLSVKRTTRQGLNVSRTRVIVNVKRSRFYNKSLGI